MEHFNHIPFSSHLANGDVSTDWAWVVVLEVLQVKAISGRDLHADTLTSGASHAGNEVLVAGSDVGDGVADVAGSGNSVVGGLLSGWSSERGNLHATLAVEGEGRGLQIILLGEEEDERASLAGVLGLDVEVEDAAHSWGDGGEVRGTLSDRWVGRVDWHDEMWVLVSTAQVGWALLVGRGGLNWLAGSLSRLACSLSGLGWCWACWLLGGGSNDGAESRLVGWCDWRNGGSWRNWRD